MERIKQNLIRARAKLLEAQLYLATVRTSEFSTSSDIRRVEKYVCLELDCVWDLQCMANGVFG